MAVVAVMTVHPSSLVVGGSPPKKLEIDTQAVSKNESSNASVESDDKKEANSNENDFHNHDVMEKREQRSQNSNFSKKPPRMSATDDYTILPEGYVPKDEDVICSWARQNHSHPGNEKFRVMINEYAPTYLNVNTKYQKSEVIAKIVAEVRSRSPGGGFIKKDFYSNRWFEVGDEKARDKVGHAIRKAAVALGKQFRGGKRQSQSLAKRRMNSNIGNFNFINATNMDMNANNLFNKAALMNGAGLEAVTSGLSKGMHFPSMNMAMNSNGNANMNMSMNASMNTNSSMSKSALSNLSGRNQLAGMQNMGATSGIMNAIGMNGVGTMGMNSITSGSFPRELEEALAMNRFRNDFAPLGGAATSDSSLLGSLYGVGKSPGDSIGLSGVNGRVGVDDSGLMDQFQRRRLHLEAMEKKEDPMTMLQGSGQRTSWPEETRNYNSNNEYSNNLSMDLNNHHSALNGINSSHNYRPMLSFGRGQGNFENMNSNSYESVSTAKNSILSKLAAANSNLMQGASNFGNGDDMVSSMMSDNNNPETTNNIMGINNELPKPGIGPGLQNSNHIHKQNGW